MQVVSLPSRRMSICFLAALTVLIFPARGDIVWSFEAGSAGWVVADLTCGSYRTPIATYSVNWQAMGGNPGGYISRGDPSNNCFSFQAPSMPLGDLRSYEGGLLFFSLKTTLNDWASDNVVILVGANSAVIVAPILPLPSASWSRYHVPFQATSFHYNTTSGAVCSDADFRAVLTNVTALRISGEFGSVIQETTSLDEVRLISPTSCLYSCDYDQDGDVDSADFLAFQQCASGAGVPQTDAACRARADLDRDGDVDQDDFGLFQACFTGPR